MALKNKKLLKDLSIEIERYLIDTFDDSPHCRRSWVVRKIWEMYTKTYKKQLDVPMVRVSRDGESKQIEFLWIFEEKPQVFVHHSLMVNERNTVSAVKREVEGKVKVEIFESFEFYESFDNKSSLKSESFRTSVKTSFGRPVKKSKDRELLLIYRLLEGARIQAKKHPIVYLELQEVGS